MWISKKSYQALIARIDLAADSAREAHDELKKLRQQQEDAVTTLRNDVDELKKLDRRGSLKPEEPETVQIDPGHVPWSQRKKNWQAANRAAAKRNGEKK